MRVDRRSRLWLLALAVLVWIAPGRAPAAVDAAAGNPRLASLQIEIWPEFDRRGAALVILRGEIASDVPLPAVVRLRIPATSGGPAEVAYSAAPGSKLFNLKFNRTDAGGVITLAFEVPERLFQVEFYEPLATKDTRRSYAYSWSGELAADRLAVVVQEPAGASEITVAPPLGEAALGQDGLRYRSAEFGQSPAGRPLELTVAYTKSDQRTSAEIVGVKAAESSPPLTTGPSRKDRAAWIIAGVLIVGVLGATVWWWYLRGTVRTPRPGDAAVCPKCRTPTYPGDRFCAKCGARLGGRT